MNEGFNEIDEVVNGDVDVVVDDPVAQMLNRVITQSDASVPTVPNVQLAPSKLEEALPEGLVNIGMVSIEIPNTEAQAAGFYSKDAGVLVAQFSQYKFIQTKGDRNVPSVTI